MNVLVTGANGFVGRNLTPALVEAGHRVTALVRDASAYDGPDGVRVVEGDLLDEASLKGDFEGIDAAYYLVHSLKAGEAFAERDRTAARTFAVVAGYAGVDRVIYLGGLGETGSDLSEHLRSRQEVESILRDGTFELTTLRAAIIIGEGSSSFTMIRQLAGRLPIMVTPRWVRTKCQPIAISDVVAYLAGVLEIPATAGNTYEIGGPEVLTYEEMIRRTAAHLGNRILIIPVPVLSLTLSVYWVDLVTNIPKHVAHPLIYGMRNPVVVTDNRIRDHLPIELTPFDEAVERALAE
ncbi:MAG: NAD(P)H-binding protein [Halobacteriota archaeon]